MENWTKLFGSPADCECEDCKSVFSPAAYLVDILQFLDNCPRNGAGNNPLDLLLGRPRNSADPIQLAGRRPDIGNLLLTCENTNTRIPYIDLVNEIMEYYVANYHGQLPFPTFPPDNELRHDTGSASSRELIAEPQYTRIDAYSSIYQNGIYPFILPYHQPLDVIRTYLEFLDSSRAELLETFQFYFDQAALAFTPIPANAIDAENLLLSLKEYEILTKVDFASLATAPVSPEAYFGNPAPAYTNAAIPVADLLQRTGLVYTELLDIIKTKLINPGQAALNVLQNLLNQAVPVVDSQTLYNELKANTWQADAGFVNALTVNGITIPKFTQWVTDNFLPFQKVITFYEPSSACDLDQTVLHSILWLYEKPAADTNIDVDFLSRLHRFIRLWRKMKWPVHELDTMIVAVGETDITAALIHKLATVKKINTVLKLPLLHLACLWGNIDSSGDQSLYARLFLKNAGKVSSNGVTEKSIFTPGPLNDILIPNTHFLKNNLPEIFAALGISANEYASIVTDSGIDPVNDKISLGNLSTIYRYKLLADTLGLSIADFCLLKSDCFKVNPFTDVDTAWDFIQKVQKLQSGAGTAFTVPLLNYILFGKSKDADNIALPQDKILDTLAALRNSLIDIEKGDLDPVSKLQSQQTQIISSVSSLTGLDIPITSTLISAGAPSLIPVSTKTGLTANYFKDEKFLLVGNTKTDNEIDFDWDLGVPDGAIGADKFSIRWTGWICAPADADYTFFLDIIEADESAALWIGGERILSLNRPEFADTIAGVKGQGVYSMKGGKMYPIIVEYVEIAMNAGIHLSWQSPVMLKAIINTQYLFPATETTTLSDKIILYHRAAKLITAFDLTVTELNYFITNDTDFDNIDFLPVDIIQWFRLYDYSFLRKTIPGKLLLPIFQLASAEEQAKPGAVASDALVSAIVSASVAGWNKEYIIFLNGFYSFKAASFKNEIGLLKLKKAIDLAIKTKMPLDATGLPAWTAIETDPSTPITGGFDLLHTVAGQIRNAVKGKYNNNWFTIAKQLNDQIRENQKQALIAYLLTLNLTLPLPPAGKPVTNADMLYEYLVIDVQVTSIVETSRLIQTTLAVQAYIDRCLLGLEKDVPAGSIDAKEWEWLKHYSIAAGLKKLFVFVENYLEPSLRDDKSPFFTDFEAALKKNDITDENAEDAFRDYLYKLNEVRNLEMCGMYNDTDTQILHVFARTNAAPYNYYYRTATNITSVFNSWTWAPWQPVQLDIKSIDDGPNSGVHLIPVVWKNRLFLFWPEFMPKNIARQAGSASFYSMANDKAPDSSGPQKFWDIRLAWSEFAHGKWTPKKISKEKISPLYFTDAEKNNISLLLVDPKSFYWTTNSSVVANSLRITLHLRSSLLKSAFGLEQLDIGAFLLSDIRDPILTSYDSSVAATIQKVQLTFNKFDFINSENLFKNHVALYVYFSPQASLEPRQCIWCWNNDGDKTDENDDIPLLDAAGNPSTVTIQVPSAVCMITVEAYTRDSDAWPAADNFENNLTVSANSIAIDFASPPSGIQKIGPTVDDEDNDGVSLYFTVALAGFDLVGSFDMIQKISTLGDIYQGELPSEYVPFFETFGQHNELIIDNSIILQNTIDYRVLFSNNRPVHNFERQIGIPFFYVDQNGHNTYFVTPFDQSEEIIVNFASPGRTTMGLMKPRTFPAETIMEKLPPRRMIATRPVAAPALNSSFASAASRNQLFLNNSDKSRYGDEVVMFKPPFNDYTLHPYFPKNNGTIGFYTFYHPFASIFIKKLNQHGIDGLLGADTLEVAQDPALRAMDDNPVVIPANDQGTMFTTTYYPDFTYVKKYDPADKDRNYYLQNVDFSLYGTYSCYNWELFFHAPLLIATSLSKNGKYAEARKWFHYIFNPLSYETPLPGNPNSPFWQVLPFKKVIADDITKFISNLSAGYNNNTEIDKWRADPFTPFLIARSRHIAFMKNTVMRYLDNLIDWADDLYITYTRENINEATLLYVMALQILGPAPQYIPARGTMEGKSYNDLSAVLTDFGDAIVQIQNSFPNSSEIQKVDSSVPQNLLGIGNALYFCIPPNDHLLQYWRKIGDRLYKIRHGQNIDGIAIPLALYEPPIDPELLLLAKSQGLDIAGILAELESPAPLYRYQYLVQKAGDFCNEVIALGNALLAANEKSDAEQLARLRQTQETDLLNMVSEVKTRQVLEAQANLDSLLSTRSTAIKRLSYYAESLLGNAPVNVPEPQELRGNLDENSSLPDETIISPVTSSIDVSLQGTRESGVKVIPKENLEMKFTEAAQVLQLSGNEAENLAAIFHLLPAFNIMTAPVGVGTKQKVISGEQLGSALAAGARGLLGIGTYLSAQAAGAGRMASYIRREQDWVFQANMAAREIVHLDKQITAAKIRLQMSARELANHRKQIANALEVAQFLETKFSKQELYDWMIGKIQQTHKLAYQLAYDMARKAEKAYRLELGIPNSNFIQYGYYNDTYLGITAGEQLQLALKQMESAYVQNNIREFELIKHISVLMIEPLALVKLKETGSCTFDLQEELFDMDYASHYYRKIKSVSISLPCIGGPYTTINGTLRLVDNSIRINTDTAAGYAHKTGAGGIFVNDDRFISNSIPFTAIATSSAQNDSGLFELIFRDERYLPFEGAGSISSWQFELSTAIQQFDYDTISDMIVHIKYTAREGDQLFKAAVEANISNRINEMLNSAGDKGLMRYFSARHDFSNEWYQFLNTPAGQDQVLSLNMGLERFPFFAQKISGKKLSITAVELFADVNAPYNPINGLVMAAPASNKNLPAVATGAVYGNLLHVPVDYVAAPELTGQWQIKNPSVNAPLSKNELKDMILVVHYKLV